MTLGAAWGIIHYEKYSEWQDKRSIEMKMGDSTTNGTDKAVENVIIIGSGPAGFTAGLYAGRASLSPLLLTGNDYGGQVTHHL